MYGDYINHAGGANRACVRVMAIIRCSDRDPICSLSRDRFLWSACLPTSLSLDPPHEHPPTHTFPAAQDEAPSDAAHVSTRGGSGGRVEFCESLRPSGP